MPLVTAMTTQELAAFIETAVGPMRPQVEDYGLFVALDELTARIGKLEEALVALVKHGPNNEDEYGIQCWYCGGNRRLLTGATVPHKEDCPWLAAKALLP